MKVFNRQEIMRETMVYKDLVRSELETIDFDFLTDTQVETLHQKLKEVERYIDLLQPIKVNRDTVRAHHIHVVKKLGKMYGIIKEMKDVDQMNDGQVMVLYARCMNQRQINLQKVEEYANKITK